MHHVPANERFQCVPPARPAHLPAQTDRRAYIHLQRFTYRNAPGQFEYVAATVESTSFIVTCHVLAVFVVNDPVDNARNLTTAEWLFTDRPRKLGLIPGVANPTGVALMAILIVIIICSQAFVRRGGCFEVNTTIIRLRF